MAGSHHDTDSPGPRIVITCEHAGRDVPRPYRPLFRGAADVLKSHRGWDPGALGVALTLADAAAAPLHLTRITRLLVEANRSPDHPQLFSPYASALDQAQREELLARYYLPHRRAIEETIADAVRSGHRVAHVGVHSFTDVLDGVERSVDIGLLFDPARAFEAELCASWKRRLESAAPDLRIRHNEPYLGIDDGLTTYLRTRFADPAYAGIEAEIRQGLIATAGAQRRVGRLLADTLRDALRG